VERRSFFSPGAKTITDGLEIRLLPTLAPSGDSVLLCTDGSYSSLSETEMAEVMNGEPQDVCEKLIELALSKQHPRQDNLTVLMMRYGTIK
jgi:serine/threonine protein phosphatase PrpC